MKKQYFINAHIIDPHNSLNEIGGIIAELKNENMKRDVWVFNNQEIFLYRLFYSDLNSELLHL